VVYYRQHRSALRREKQRNESMSKTRSAAHNSPERQSIALRAELARLQLQRRNLEQRINASYAAPSRSRGADRKSQSAHALEVERTQIDNRIADLRQRIEQLDERAAPPAPQSSE
jgi:hypothetical protein